MIGQDTNTIPVTGVVKPPVKTVAPQKKQITEKWLTSRLDSLYNDPDYKNATPERQQFYKQRAYEKWAVPYYKHVGQTVPSLEEFLGTKKPASQSESAMIASYHGSDRQAQATEQQRIQALKDEHHERSFFAGVKVADETISGISNIFSFLSKYSGQGLEWTEHGIRAPQKSNQATKVFDRATDYYDKQAQDMEDRIQDLGGHNLETNMSSLVAQASLFEATGGAKAASFIKLANPETAAFSVRLLKAQWNGAVNGLFWDLSTGAKPKDIPMDVSTFAIFDGVGLHSKGLAQALGVFSKSAPREVMQQTIKNAAEGLVKDGVPLPKQAEFNVDNYQQNNKAATAVIARTLNEMAGLKNTKKVLNAKDMNGAFKKLTPAQQKEVMTRLFMMLSQSQDIASHDLATQLAPQYIKESEANAAKVVPKVSQEVQKSVNDFVKKRMPQASDADITHTKYGAILPRHTTTDKSPIAHVSARISWLSNTLKRGDKTLAADERRALQQALTEEKELYKTMKAAKRDLEAERLKEVANPKADTSYFEQAKKELPNASLSEQIQRASKLKAEAER